MRMIVDTLIVGGVGAVAAGVYVEFGLGYSLICGGLMTLTLGLAAIK